MGANIFHFELRNSSTDLSVAVIQGLKADSTLRKIKEITGIKDCKLSRRGKIDIWDVISPTCGNLNMYILRVAKN